jgi:hypothetical protein
MASTTTPLIGLYKATPGTNEPFRAADINDNWDILDTFIVNYEDRFEELETEANEAVQSVEAALEDIEEGLASLDTAAILDAIDEGFSIDGGSA